MEVDTVKAETEVCIPSGGDSFSMEMSDVYMPSAFSIQKYEPEQNINTVKAETDVDVVSKEGCTGMKTDEVYKPSHLSICKTEYENCTDVLEPVSGVCTEMCLTASDVKLEEFSDTPEEEEEDPLSMTSPAVKAEQEDMVCEHQLMHSEEHPYSCGVSNDSYSNQSSTSSNNHIHSQAPPFSCVVCNKSFTYHSDLKKHQHIHTGMEVQKKWHSLRNCFARELRLQKETKSGQGAKKRRKYIYFEKLLFLLPSVENREHRGNLNVRSFRSSLSDIETESEVACEGATGERRREYGQRRKPATQIEMYEESLLKILEQKKHADTDEDVNFALSLVPIIRSLDDYKKIEAKIQIMNVLKNLKWPGGYLSAATFNRKTEAASPASVGFNQSFSDNFTEDSTPELLEL